MSIIGFNKITTFASKYINIIYKSSKNKTKAKHLVFLTVIATRKFGRLIALLANKDAMPE